VTTHRWAWAEIDLDALGRNVTFMRSLLSGSDLWAVVKAGAYGHGAVPVAQAALRAGAVGLCVALTQEGEELRDAGIDAPILLLSEQPPQHSDALVAARLIPTVYSVSGVRALADAVRACRLPNRYPVHVKVDTGMHRVGVSLDDVALLLSELSCHEVLELQSVFTHLAVADEPDHPYTLQQLDRFRSVLAGRWDGPTHVANSAAVMSQHDAHQSFVRVGMALYGLSPGPGVDELAASLEPVMSLRGRVSFVKQLCAGEPISYGLRYRLDADATIATVPLGYADGVPRRLSLTGGEVLVRGQRCPIVGSITMDQLMVDCGNLSVDIGDEVVLLGQQGEQRITATDWATRVDTIAYEMICGISLRIPRVYTGSVVEG
jgi:alanine racemase